MNNLHIRREHDLDEDESRALAEDLLGQLANKFGGSVEEYGDSYEYKHSSGMKASVQAKDGELDIFVKLNLLTRAFAPEIEKQVNAVLDKYVG